MAELILSVTLLITAFMLHLAIWQVYLPKRQTRAILVIFFGLLLVAVVMLPTIARQLPSLGLPLPVPLHSYLQIIIFMTACTLAYMITYTTIEVDSPSLVMAMTIHNAGTAGIPEEEFVRMMNDELLIVPRIRDMLRDGLATRQGDRYFLTPKGRRMAKLFILHRRLLGAGMGG